MLSPESIEKLRSLPLDKVIKYWSVVEQAAIESGDAIGAVRMLCLADLFYLMVRVCKRKDMLNQFAFERCREVEASPYGHIDLWAREHFKSSIQTFGHSIQSILKDPNITIGLFSHTRPIAKAFLRQIMRELVENETLHAAFPDILWGKDTRSAPKWSEDEGFIVKRTQNPNEATMEAWGLVDGQPTSKHFKVLHYDDIVVQGSVSNPEMIQKTMTSLEQSYNLGVTPGGVRKFIGTRWHFNDAYRTIKDRGTAIAREHPGRVGGTEDGDSVFWSEDVHLQKRRDMGPYTYAAQILLNPKADALQGFKREWLRYYDKINITGMNIYLLVDSANAKRKTSDYTSIWAIGLGMDGNYYAVDWIRDRLNLTERANRLFEFHRKYKPKQVRYERYGLIADIEHIKSEQEHQNYRFDITEVSGQSPKADRIKRLLPIFEGGRFYLPRSKFVTDWQKVPVDLVHSFIEEEYFPFPVGLHDDCFPADAPIITLEGEKPISEVTTNDYVLTGNGTFKKVLKAWCKGTKEVITRHGITATPEHKIFTLNREWVSLDSLCENDTILVCNTVEDTSCVKHLNLTEENIIGIRKQNNQTIGNTIPVMISGRQIQECSIETFGNSITDKSLEVITSIMPTGIAITTKSQTSSAFQVLPIKLSIGKKQLTEGGQQNILNIWRISEHSLKNGIVQRKGLHGIGSTQNNQSCKMYQKDHVLNVLESSSQKCQSIDYVEKNASGVEPENLQGKSMPVYDLTVEGRHEFFVYGVLAHNCMDSLSRIAEPDLKLVWPKEQKPDILPPVRNDIPNSLAWMGG